jgi:hypothetical protein
MMEPAVGFKYRFFLAYTPSTPPPLLLQGLGDAVPIVVIVGGRASTAAANVSSSFAFDAPVLSGVFPGTPPAAGGATIALTG